MRSRIEIALVFLVVLGVCWGGCDDDDDDTAGNDDADDDNDVDDDATDDDDDDDNDDNDNDNDDDDDDDDDDNDTAPPADDWRFVRDDQGGALILHGCNLDGGAKNDTGLPPQDREQVLDLSRVWGFNFMRYLIFWYQIEPEPGVYNEAYLDEVETRLDWLAEVGIKVVLDMHQDLWGPAITEDWGGSDGAPAWATITDGWPHIPFSQWLGNWGFDYLSPAVNRAFDNFWDYEGAHPELQDHYAAMWAHVAERFGDHPAILGYDPMNEPWQGTDLLNYYEFDQTKYSDFNERVIAAIRAVDDERWIFFEPCAFGPNQGMPSFMRVLDDPREGENRLAYFPHFYPLLVDLTGGYQPEVDHSIETWAGRRTTEAERQQAPLLVGEWSMLRWFDDDNRHLWTGEAMAMLDRVSSGWAYWDCGWFLRDEDETFRELLTAAYPRRVGGHPLTYGYDPATRVLTVEFESRAGVTGPTEIFLPAARDYPDGWTVGVSPPEAEWTYEWDETAEVLSVWVDSDWPVHTIRVAPEDGRTR